MCRVKSGLPGRVEFVIEGARPRDSSGREDGGRRYGHPSLVTFTVTDAICVGVGVEPSIRKNFVPS
jgi:hypothetical protein